MNDLVVVATVLNFVVSCVSKPCPNRMAVSDTTVAKLLRIFCKQDGNRVQLRGVSGYVHEFEYDDVTASKFSVSGLDSLPHYRRYCVDGRADVVEVDYTFSAELSALWWRRGHSGSFDVHIHDVGMVVHYVVGHSEHDGSSWLCTDNIELSGIGRPNITLNLYDGSIDGAVIEAVHTMLEMEEQRLVRKIKHVLISEVIACGGSLPRSEQTLQEEGVSRQVTFFRYFNRSVEGTLITETSFRQTRVPYNSGETVF